MTHHLVFLEGLSGKKAQGQKYEKEKKDYFE